MTQTEMVLLQLAVTRPFGKWVNKISGIACKRLGPEPPKLYGALWMFAGGGTVNLDARVFDPEGKADRRDPAEYLLASIILTRAI
jgi:hypothetical protein